MHPCTLHATYFPHFFPLHRLIQGLSSVSVTQYQWPCSLIALTGPGLTRRDMLSHVAGDALLACCLSLHLFGVLWMQPDKKATEELRLPLSAAWHWMPEFKNTTLVTVAQVSLLYSLVSSCICVLWYGWVGTLLCAFVLFVDLCFIKMTHNNYTGLVIQIKEVAMINSKEKSTSCTTTDQQTLMSKRFNWI